jgi:hypothetical protein
MIVIIIIIIIKILTISIYIVFFHGLEPCSKHFGDHYYPGLGCSKGHVHYLGVKSILALAV